MTMAKRIVQEIPVLYRPNMQIITTKEKVCAYARVSTENDEQEDSFENQCKHFTDLINSRPDWEFVGIYADQGITGTKASSRKEFMRMIDDCRSGKINRILVKSISRFARNTVDSLMYIREFKELGISVFFESEQIDTLTPGGEVLITILSAIAEQESRNMSTNIKWAYQKRFKEGEVLINFKGSLGYTREKINGKYVGEYKIIEEEAEIVRRIFREFIGGASCAAIAERLTAEGIKTAKGKTNWSTVTVQNILKNEKYTGNALLGKTFKPDVLSKRRIKNEGQAPSYYVKNSHPAIISQEVFDLAQAELMRRKMIRSNTKTGEGKYSSKYALSGLLICADCGSKFRRYGRSLASGKKVATWVCITHQKSIDKCTMLPIKETDIYDAYRRVIERLSGDLREVTQTVRDNIELEFAEKLSNNLAEGEELIAKIQEEILELFKKKRDGIISPYEYDIQYKNLSEKLIKLQAEQTKLREESFASQLKRQRLKDITELLTDNIIHLTDETIMKRLLENIKVVSKHEIELQFKCGIKSLERI